MDDVNIRRSWVIVTRQHTIFEVLFCLKWIQNKNLKDRYIYLVTELSIVLMLTVTILPVIGWICPPPRFTCWSSNTLRNVTFFRNRVPADVVKSRWHHTGVGYPPNPACPYKKGEFGHDTQGEQTPCDDEGRDGGEVAEVRELQRFPATQQKLGERNGADPPQKPPEEINPADSFLLELPASRMVRQ